MHKHFARVVMLVMVLALSSAAQAQTASEAPWSVEFGIGWDNGISGNINSSAIGTLNNQTVVILKNKYEDVSGLHLRWWRIYVQGRYRGSSHLRSIIDADLARMGDLGVSNLYGQR
jgi:hypothetical protein